MEELRDMRDLRKKNHLPLTSYLSALTSHHSLLKRQLLHPRKGNLSQGLPESAVPSI